MTQFEATRPPAMANPRSDFRGDLAEFLPPHGSYPYFREAERFPLDAMAAGFSTTNAWWLAECAALAYGDRAYVEPRLRAAGLSLAAVYDAELQLDCKADMRAFVAENDSCVIVSVKGTSVAGLSVVRDAFTDLHALLVKEQDDAGRVHQGVKRVADCLWYETNLRSTLAEFKQSKPSRGIWFTGHSLGAAIAVLLARRLGQDSQVYTYGCPRVGDDGFVNAFERTLRGRCFRYVHNNDIVPRLPLTVPVRVPLLPRYLNVGDLRYIDSRGTVHEGSMGLWPRCRDAWSGRAQMWERAAQAWGRLVASKGRERKVKDFLELPLDDLLDHSPIYYMRATRDVLVSASRVRPNEEPS